MSDTIILVTNDGMGQGPIGLRQQLATKYFQLLHDDHKFPAAICFYTEGVRLVCNGSPSLDQLKALQKQGVLLIVCQTCLDYLGLRDQVQVGIIGSMGDIIEAQWQAGKVITI